MDLYRINLNLLIALDVLLTEQNVTRAAEKLFITQAAMSNNLQQLRAIFKDELLLRQRNYMVLTSFAKELQPKLHQVLQELHSLIATGQRFVPETSQRLFKIGMPDYIASLLLPSLMRELKEKGPHIKIMVTSAFHLVNTEPFEKGDYDLGIGKLIELGNLVHKQLLFKDTGVCIMHPHHKLAKKKKITFSDYIGHQHVAVKIDSPYFPPLIEQELAKLGYQRDIQVSLPFVSSIFKIIEESDHLLGTVINKMAILYKKNHRFLIKDLPFKIPAIEFFLAWHQRYDNDPGHRWLRQLILKIAEKF